MATLLKTTTHQLEYADIINSNTVGLLTTDLTVDVHWMTSCQQQQQQETWSD